MPQAKGVWGLGSCGISNLQFLLKNNVLSLSSVIELCRKMRKFEVLVYTSTAYNNCNHLNFPLKEEVYRLPFHAGQFLDGLKFISASHSKRPQQHSGKVPVTGPEGSRLETRFSRRSAVYGANCTPRSGQMYSRWCGVEAWRGYQLR
ncbi:hypothetical protein AVEN_239517-1 [Araneus ventricosus]|uniref:Thioester reductase (TE) domain-containing protein n=1 Tax=Araneus ventricosus TaxID=182803 RepID=A0A4Y2TBK4_ARAVE|nr:hypothetical protein AVEN_239517-1 [Araneus ventricosus]